MPTDLKVSINPESLLYDLPEALIAQEPLKERDQAKLLVVDRKRKTIGHSHFFDLPDLLEDGDVLVINKAKVNPYKFMGKKKSGGKVQMILIERLGAAKRWRALLRPAIPVGTMFTVGQGCRVTLVDRTEDGENIVEFEEDVTPHFLSKQGQIPLPPYIKRIENDPRSANDFDDYQTVYSAKDGSIAAPTAGLHFTRSLLKNLEKKGVVLVDLVLHVGWGTFRPVHDSIEKHTMLKEKYEISAASLRKLQTAHHENRRIIAVGTTVTRVLESLSDFEARTDMRGDTDLFIKPGFKFKWLAGLVTNFHVPRSTPLALTMAFCGRDLLENAYSEAIAHGYRFFSYGDAMMIV